MLEIDWWRFENNVRRAGFKTIAGIDEAGRGPLAGPVVAAAVILPEDKSNDRDLSLFIAIPRSQF